MLNARGPLSHAFEIDSRPTFVTEEQIETHCVSYSSIRYARQSHALRKAHLNEVPRGQKDFDRERRGVHICQLHREAAVGGRTEEDFACGEAQARRRDAHW